MCLPHYFLGRMQMLLLAHLGALVAVVALRLSILAFLVVTEVDHSLPLTQTQMHLLQLESVHQGSLGFHHSINYLSD